MLDTRPFSHFFLVISTRNNIEKTQDCYSINNNNGKTLTFESIKTPREMIPKNIKPFRIFHRALGPPRDVPHY